jgi:hypothetical protein
MDKMRENAASKGKELANTQGQDFLRTIKRESWQVAPTPQELYDTAQRVGWALKRKKGVSPAKELKRRIRARGTFARGWRIVRIVSEKWRIRIWLMDKSAESDKVDTRHGVSDKAEKKSGGRFKQRLNRMADAITRAF